MPIRKLTPEEKERVRRVLYEDDTVSGLLTTEELNQFAGSYNWDDDRLEELYKVIRHPLCDKGTALRLYWLAGPGWLYGHYADRNEIVIPEQTIPYMDTKIVLLKEDLKHYDFIKEIEERFKAGCYTRQNIRFDPNEGWLNDYSEYPRKQPIPLEMLAATPGEAVEWEIFE